MILFLEIIVSLVLYTYFIVQSSKNPLDIIYDYPPKIVKRVEEMGLVDTRKRKTSKLIFMVVVSILFAIMFSIFNDVNNFWDAFILSYIIWFIVTIYDTFVIDCLWFCHDKRFIINGTEDLTREYKNYMFHIINGVKSLILGVVVSLLTGSYFLIF